MSHQHLIFSTITTTRVMFDDTGTSPTDPDARITVTCDAAPNPRNNGRHDRTRYTISIFRAPTANFSKVVTYSLLTLGLQALRHRINIRSAISSNNDAKILDAAEKPKGASAQVPPTGTVKVPPANIEENPDTNNIWFLRFSGQSCTVLAEAIDRNEVGSVIWTSGTYGGGHDNTPPGGGPD